MFEGERDPEEVDLIDLFLVMWKRKYGMMTLFFVSVIVGSLHAFFIAPKIYSVKATFMPLKSERGLPSGLGTFASFVGISGVQTGGDDINRFINILQRQTSL